ncbi:MAG: hypothetical protein ACI8RZ_007509 [Myxococcota bacterium]
MLIHHAMTRRATLLAATIAPHLLSGPMLDVGNEAARLGTTLRSALQAAPADTELIVVDNMSTDTTAQQVTAHSDRVRLVCCPQFRALWNQIRRLPTPRARAMSGFMFCTRSA